MLVRALAVMFILYSNCGLGLADALQAGKIQIKVLKLTGEVQVLNIKLAQAKAKGSDTASIESKIKEEQ